MDPISLSLILGALVVSAAACTVPKAIADAYASYRAARDGRWDVVERGRQRPGFFERLGTAWGSRRVARHQQAGGSGDYRPGVGAYAKDLYHGFFEDALERRQAKRAARPPYVYDPDRPKWHERVDDAVLRGARGAKARWDEFTGRVQAERAQPADTVEPEPPVEYPPGTVTYGPDGQRMPLAPPAEDVAPEPDAEPDPVEDEHDEHHDPEPDRQQEDDMTAPAQTPQADAATEVNTNEDARRAFEAQVRAAGEAADALAVYEAAQAKLAALAAAGTDGMSAKAFDGNATAAQYDISDLLTTTQMSGAAAAIDGIKTQAEAGVRHLDKYRDAEDLVAAEQVDTTTLAPTAA